MFRSLLATAGSLTLVLITIVGLVIFSQRDYFFTWDWAQEPDSLSYNHDPKLHQLARQYWQEKARAEMGSEESFCPDHWVASDNESIYMLVGCNQGESRLLLPTRFLLNPEDNKVVAARQPDPDSYDNTVRRIFPKSVYSRMLEILEAHSQ